MAIKHTLTAGQALVVFLRKHVDTTVNPAVSYGENQEVVLPIAKAADLAHRQIVSVSSIKDADGPRLVAALIPAEADLKPIGETPSTWAAEVERTHSGATGSQAAS